ncbi:MAG: hypothetical protein ASARMPREDX12_000268 [Alectoria sarmentosa]|nr:MAG: hypothetical protein ASARMPREDX12_000268 [Alectoria sarmentosa]
MSESLWLKSAETPTTNLDSKQSGSSTVLCTNDHTYQLRQVQSSNSIFILLPSESVLEDNQTTTPSLSAIAQCTATLELIPSDPAASFAMASHLLKESLPSYKGTDTDVGLGTHITFSRKYKDKKAIFQDAPFSTEEFDKTWNQLCAFEVLDRAWLPTPSTLTLAWKSILSAATVRGVNLEKSFDFKSLVEMVGHDGFPEALIIAVVIRLASNTDYLKDDYVSLDRDKTVQWVGIICLQKAGESGQASTEGIAQSDFLAQWHDLLPEGWRKHASMDLLKVSQISVTLYQAGLTATQAKVSHSDPSKGKIVFGEDIYDPTSLETLPSANTGGQTNRKWHDKFRMGRK